ncbi:hypothetical protein BGZ91_009843 [Linnemannia elongata]|nr:hypothetical protein BGZ91_009843 [Linnemannia elongata]
MKTGGSIVLISQDQIADFIEEAESCVEPYWKTPIEELKFSPSCDQIASIHNLCKSVMIWNDFGDFQQALKHNSYVRCSAFSSCGQWIATGGNMFAWLWNSTGGDGGIQEWNCVSKILDFFDEVISIAWRPDTLEFATCCGDGSVRVWRVQTGSSGVSTQLIRSTGPDFFVATKAVIADTTGISDPNRRLLLQRGATD